MNRSIPGWEGAVGPFPGQYREPHVYARDVHSGAGNCVCGSALGDWIHPQAAPGVDVPESMRPARRERGRRHTYKPDARGSDNRVCGQPRADL